MRRWLGSILKGIDLQGRIFYKITIFGILASLLAFISAIVSKLDSAGIAAAALCGLYMLLVFLYSLRSKHIKACIFAVCIGFNFVLFPLNFFYSGGLNGGIPAYLVLGIVAINLLLQGKWKIILTVLTIVFDTWLMQYGYYHPEVISQFKSPELAMIDKVQSVIIVSLLIGMALTSFSHEYERQDRQIKALNAKLRERALTDHLTSLYNRSYVDEELLRLIHKAQQQSSRFAVIMMDIDFFKSVNDKYGHLVGDEVLQSVADILKQESASLGIAGRYGGEEFLIVLSDAGREQALELAERIRSTVESSLHGESEQLAITISGGVAEYDGQMMAEDLIKLADDNLYRAKASGRNKIVAAI